MLSVNGDLDTPVGPFPDAQWPFPSTVFTVPENYNIVMLIPPNNFLSRDLFFILRDLFS